VVLRRKDVIVKDLVPALPARKNVAPSQSIPRHHGIHALPPPSIASFTRVSALTRPPARHSVAFLPRRWRARVCCVFVCACVRAFVRGGGSAGGSVALLVPLVHNFCMQLKRRRRLSCRGRGAWADVCGCVGVWVCGCGCGCVAGRSVEGGVSREFARWCA
jgi:hypothetical protein